MSIKSLMGDSDIKTEKLSLEGYKIPTKFGLIVDRCKELKTQAWGGRESDKNLDDMSKFMPEK